LIRISSISSHLHHSFVATQKEIDMSLFERHQKDVQPENAPDLRQGIRGCFTVREPNLAGASPQHNLDSPHLVSPGLSHPAGQTTHG
jgi:hypothetical protein